MLFNPGIRFGDARDIESIGQTGFLYFRVDADGDASQFRNCTKCICFANESPKRCLKLVSTFGEIPEGHLTYAGSKHQW